MPSKFEALYNQPQPFNDRAHAILSDVLDEAERWLIRNGVCQPHEADEYLTMAFIKESGAFLEHATAYLENEGRFAADLFLWMLPKGKAKARYLRNDQKCALQLHWHTIYYFRTYHVILRQTSLRLLRTLPGIAEIDRNGVLMLAAANLPGVRADIRRERRFRGAERERTIVSDEAMSCRILHVERRIDSMGWP